MSTNEANWDANLADAKLLGQQWTGSGGFAAPGIGSYENVLATAETLNRLGERSVKNGTGTIFGHNHTSEFTTKYVDAQGDGTLKSAWQILVREHRPALRELPARRRLGGQSPARIPWHWSSSSGTASSCSTSRTSSTSASPPQRQTTVGQGEVDWAALFAAVTGADPPVRHRAGSAGGGVRPVRVRRGELRVRRLPAATEQLNRSAVQANGPSPWGGPFRVVRRGNRRPRLNGS